MPPDDKGKRHARRRRTEESSDDGNDGDESANAPTASATTKKATKKSAEQHSSSSSSAAKKKKKKKSKKPAPAPAVPRGMHVRPVIVQYETIVDTSYHKKKSSSRKVKVRLTDHDFKRLDPHNNLKITLGTSFTKVIIPAIVDEISWVNEDDPDPQAPLGYEPSPESLLQGAWYVRSKINGGRNTNLRRTEHMQAVNSSEEWKEVISNVGKWVATVPPGYDEKDLDLVDKGHYVIDLAVIVRPIIDELTDAEDEAASQVSKKSKASQRSRRSSSNRPTSRPNKEPVRAVPKKILIRFGGLCSKNEKGTYEADSRDEIDPSVMFLYPNQFLPAVYDSDCEGSMVSQLSLDIDGAPDSDQLFRMYAPTFRHKVIKYAVDFLPGSFGIDKGVVGKKSPVCFFSDRSTKKVVVFKTGASLYNFFLEETSKTGKSARVGKMFVKERLVAESRSDSDSDSDDDDHDEDANGNRDRSIMIADFRILKNGEKELGEEELSVLDRWFSPDGEEHNPDEGRVPIGYEMWTIYEYLELKVSIGRIEDSDEPINDDWLKLDPDDAEIAESLPKSPGKLRSTSE